MTKSIKEKISSFPKSPGVYQFIGESGDILYIGKAKNLSNRVKSYFLKEIGRGPGIDLMVQLAFDIDFIETESEIEAILLEAQLINNLKPKYNIRLRDDKSFLVIKISKLNYSSSDSEKSGVKVLGNTASNNISGRFSCVELVRFKNVDFSDKSAEYFGPYPSGLLLKKSLNYLRKIFPFRDCSKTKYNTYRKKGRPCIYGDIRVCTGPCVDWVNEDRYNKNILYLKNFLRGKKQEICKQLKKDMKKLSAERKFEEAALIRNRLNALDHLKDVAIGIRDDVFSSATTLFHRVECYDISNIGGEYAVGSMVVFEDGKKDSNEYRRFKIRNPKSEIRNKSQIQNSNKPNDLEMMKEMLLRRFNNDWPLPDLVVIDGGETHLKIATKVLKENNLSIPVVSIAKGPERKKNEFHFSDSNLAKYFHGNTQLENLAISARDESHRFAISYYRELHKKGMFK